MIHCFILLGKYNRLADLIHALLLGTYQQRVIAYQIAYDIEDVADQNLTGGVAELLVVKESEKNNVNYTVALVKVKEIL